MRYILRGSSIYKLVNMTCTVLDWVSSILMKIRRIDTPGSRVYEAFAASIFGKLRRSE